MMARLRLAENLQEAVTFIEQGRTFHILSSSFSVSSFLNSVS
mgnify:CR=1 FL=1